MLTHSPEVVHPQQIIRGMKVPCAWDYSTCDNHSEDHLASEQSKSLLFHGPVPKKVRIRRDGLFVLNVGNSAVEWFISPELVRKMESGYWQDSVSFEKKLDFLTDTKIEYYGVPSLEPNSIFSAPLTVQWDLTSCCNLHCKHCYADATAEKGKELTRTQVLRVVEEAERIGVLAFHLLGGEPFVRDDLIDVVQHACQLGISCHISSNGTLIQPKHARALEGLHNLTVDVSLDSTRPSYHDWLRGQKGAYQKAVEGIQCLRERDIQFGTTCTIYPDTLDEMEAITKQAIDFGAYRLQFLFVSPVGRARRYQNELLLEDRERSIFTAQFKYLVKKYADTILVDSPVVPFEPEKSGSVKVNDPGLWLVGCLAGIEKMAIRSDGSVTACPQLKREYGNVQTSTIQEIWANIHSERLARLGKGCDICAFDGYCGGGCPAPNSYDDEVVPCSGRKQRNAINHAVIETSTSLWCSFDCPFPCDCPTWCNSPCPFPCDCPTWCNLPCSSPCRVPCPHPR